MIQLLMQDSWSPLMFFICSFHDTVMIVVLMILSIVTYIFVVIFLNPCTNRFFFGNETLELFWTVIPGVVLVFLALPSLHTLYLADEINNPAMSIKVIGNQWFWSYEYSDFEEVEFSSYMVSSSDLIPGDFRLLETDNNTVLPIGVEVRIMITSVDVIHSWTIPSMGIKVDAVPGRLNQLCLLSIRGGLSYGQCSEICGALHSFMPICVELISEHFFVKWLSLY